MENFSTDTDGVVDIIWAEGHDHVLLDVGGPVGVHAAVRYIHHRTRERKLRIARDFGEVPVERDFLLVGNCFRGSERDGENCVGTEAGFVFCTVEVDHGVVNIELPAGILAEKGGFDAVVNVRYCSKDTLAVVFGGVVVAEFQRFTGASRRTGRYGGTSEATTFEKYVGLYGGIAARV